MEKLLLKSLILLVSVIIACTGCGYNFVSAGRKPVFVEPVENLTLNPRLDIHLERELRKIFQEKPVFNTSETKDSGVLVLKVSLKETDRSPLFFGRENNSEIVSARFYMEAEIGLFKDGQELFRQTLKEDFSYSLSIEYREDEMMSAISKKMAKRIYFILVEKNEKEAFF